jgi:hypothetical protein
MPFRKLVAGLLAALFALSWSTAVLAQSFYATPSAPVNIAATATTQIIAGVPGARIYVIGFLLYASGTLNVTIEYGTGSGCSSPVVLAGPLDFTAQGGAAPGGFNATMFYAPAGQSICLVTSANPQLGGFLSYWQY